MAATAGSSRPVTSSGRSTMTSGSGASATGNPRNDKSAKFHLNELVAQDIAENPAHIALSGYLKKRGSHAPYTWRKYWFVFYNNADTGVAEIRYYSKVIHASFANVPIDERGEIPLRLVRDVTDSKPGKYGGGRFNLIYEQFGNSHYSGMFKPEDATEDFRPHLRSVELLADDAHTKDVWCGLIRSALLKDDDDEWRTAAAAAAAASGAGAGATLPAGPAVQGSDNNVGWAADGRVMQQ